MQVEELNENNETVEVDQSVESEAIGNVQVEESEEKTYTQADIDNLQAKIDELIQYKPEEVNDAEIKLQEKAETLWNKQVDLDLKEHGLEVFKDFIRADVDDTDALQKQITKLKEIVGVLELSNSYQPTNYKPVDAYSIAKKNRNSIDMISAKLKS
ncbi:xanthine phosphoribosyltransferase [Priestia megaterium]|uniref:xanthine phosphoribosyltransferase n=1 Tax=Priestia megaterium TaxID=1404 RepID=UPI002E1A6DB3|nr:xanthine phosphoribosyltransferase [Priestia megaterium]